MSTSQARKERGNSGGNRTIKKIPSYTTNNDTKMQRERGRGEREERKRVRKTEWLQHDYRVAFYIFALVKSR